MRLGILHHNPLIWPLQDVVQGDQASTCFCLAAAGHQQEPGLCREWLVEQRQLTMPSQDNSSSTMSLQEGRGQAWR
jgi:hypothetical protein